MPKRREIVTDSNCKICNDQSHGYHFGVLVCRACAAFFRRTVALNLRYYCRFNNKCQIDKSVKNMCRCCRSRKCRDVGMKPEAVRLTGEKHGKRSRVSCLKEEDDDDHIEVDDSPTPKLVTPMNSETNVDSAFALPSLSPQAPSTSQALPMTPMPCTLITPPGALYRLVNNIFEEAKLKIEPTNGLSLLERMYASYNQLLTKRTKVHCDQIVDYEDPTINKEEKTRRIEYNYGLCMKMMKAEVILFAEMITSFGPFIYLPPDQRWLLFRHFYNLFNKYERPYDTLQCLGDEPGDDRLLLPNGHPVKLNSVSMHSDTIQAGKMSEILKLYQPSNKILLNDVLKPMKMLKPTGIEFIAIAGHLLWLSPGTGELSEETLSIAREARQAIFIDLHDYYVNRLHITMYATRLGEFMALLSAIEKIMAYKREFDMVVEFFDMFELDPALKEIIICKGTFAA